MGFVLGDCNCGFGRVHVVRSSPSAIPPKGCHAPTCKDVTCVGVCHIRCQFHLFSVGVHPFGLGQWLRLPNCDRIDRTCLHLC